MSKAAFYGIDVLPDGSVIVARHSGAAVPELLSYPGTASSYQAIQDEIRGSSARPHVCMRSGPSTLSLAQALTGVRGIRLTMVPSAAVIDPAATGEEIVRFLAQLAAQLA